MRTGLFGVMLCAGAVAGCAGEKASPPPPAPSPLAQAAADSQAIVPVDGVYRGRAVLQAGSPSQCREITDEQQVRVQGDRFAIAGLRASVGDDGQVSAPSSGGASLTGAAKSGTMNLTLTQGSCVYVYTLGKQRR